ncbi:MAG: hypothetical protein DMF63_12860 [Acidobacteria bacterium]|nr:MAG: hypothetical protein DMF63_12860 [Acidobacteriota bacterium]
MQRFSSGKLTSIASVISFFFLVHLPNLPAQTKVIWQKAEVDPYTHVVFSHSGSMLALGREDSNTSDLLNAADGSLIRQFTGRHNAVNDLVFTLDDQYLITGVGHGGASLSLSIWNVGAGNRLMLVGDHTNGTQSVSLSTDGQYVATSGEFDRETNIWHVPDLTQVISILNSDPETGVLSRVKDVAFSPDGQRIATGDINGVRVRSSISGTLLYEIPSFEVRSIAYSPDGQYIAGAVPTDHAVKLWNASTGALVRTFAVNTAFDFPSIAFSPNGKLLAAGYHTGSDAGALIFWSISNGRVLSYENTSGSVISLAFDPTGQSFAYTQSDGRVVRAIAPPV